MVSVLTIAWLRLTDAVPGGFRNGVTAVLKQSSPSFALEDRVKPSAGHGRWAAAAELRAAATHCVRHPSPLVAGSAPSAIALGCCTGIGS
jgi:hypothetical protein